MSDWSATITVTVEGADSNMVSDTLDAEVVDAEVEVDHGPRRRRCIIETDRVVFLWDSPVAGCPQSAVVRMPLQP